MSVLAMKHRPRSSEQDDLLRSRLIDVIDARHELEQLMSITTQRLHRMAAALIDYAARAYLPRVKWRLE